MSSPKQDCGSGANEGAAGGGAAAAVDPSPALFSAAVELDSVGGNVYLMRFESRKMESFLHMVKEHLIVDASTVVCCTGGGSRKYDTLFKEVLGLTIHKADELGCLVDGINFTLQRHMKELYRVHHATFK